MLLIERISRIAACSSKEVPMFRIALSLLTLLTFAGADASAAAMQTKAPYALLIDASSGKILLQKNADAPMTPASTTKILTAEVVFSELAAGRLKLDDMFLVSAHAASEGDAESGGSSMFAQAGSRARIEDLLQGLLVASGNDAAITLAEGIAGTEAAFAGLMNAHARAIGMTHSYFANPWGAPGNRVTARDMAQLAAYVIATYPQYYRYFGESEFTWNGVRQQNRNPLLQVGADGLKTGHLAASGYGLVGSGARAAHRLILVLNGLKSEKERAREGQRLLEWGFQEAR
jgi:D-alanyl-D-alanine carboxypeptidase (penicillin-binding protein 5/6)